MTFTKPFPLFGKLTFNKHVNVLERYCKGGISSTFTTPLFPKSKVLEGLISRSCCCDNPELCLFMKLLAVGYEQFI